MAVHVPPLQDGPKGGDEPIPGIVGPGETMGDVTVLIVDDEQLVRWSLRQGLEERGHRVLEAETRAQALERLAEGADLVLLDLRLPDTEGLDLLRQMRKADPEALVILMTAYSTVESAVEAIQEGAYHYFRKPFEVDEVLLLVDKALETTRLRREVRDLRARQSSSFGFERIIGESPVMQEVKATLRKIADSPATTVLLTGESGTGKDATARALHHDSARAGQAFMVITCSAIPEALLESELFGHERGAFTDARQQRKGLLELADRGTVFLDEVAEMAPPLQAKLLRFLEEKAFKRVGGSRDLKVDVRVVAATNRDLREEVAGGRFREDLFYRLNVLPVRLPALRERQGDVQLLAGHFLETFAREFRRPVRALVPEARELLEAYRWPGNVRELKNAMERAVLLCEGEALLERDFRMLPATLPVRGFRLPDEGLDFADLERDLVHQALERAGGNQTKAATLLGMSRDQIRYRVEKFGLAAAEAEAPQE
jgi:DNA-binding NtrC family response regulator